MSSGRNIDPKFLAELRKSLASDEKAENEKTYTFRQYTIDGRRYSTLSDLKNHEIKVVTPEESIISEFAKMLSASSDAKTRDFARTVKNLIWLHKAGGDKLRETPLFEISREYNDKTLSTRPGSVERDFLLITAIEKIKSAYRSL